MQITGPPRSPAAWHQDTRPLVAMDWSSRAVHVTFDGHHVTKLPGVDGLLRLLGDTPHRIAAEATFESWDRPARARSLAQLRAAGHEMYVYRPTHTARNRPEGMSKTDANDARVIHSLAVGGRLHLYPIPEPDPSWVAHRTRVNAAYLEIRGTGGKGDLVKAASAVLGRYSDIPDPEMRAVLGNGTTYSPSLLAATYFAAQHASSRDQFERLLGLHGSGYPSLLRSDVHHHSWRWAAMRGVTWQQFRRQLRRTYAAFKADPNRAALAG